MSSDPSPPISAEPLNPAPYGHACTPCSRAKVKCFLRAPGTDCERCHRRGMTCIQSAATRKRKARSPPPAGSAAPRPPAARPVSSASRLEEKLEDLVTLLRFQVVEKQAAQSTPPSVRPDDLVATRNPDVVIDTNRNVVHLLRPSSTLVGNASILEDVSAYQIAEKTADEQLDIFRNVFIPMFPFVHLPKTIRASELRKTRPFLWLVVMALATKSVSQQFLMEDMIWKIISQRIVAEHLVDVDLLLGVVCFASWSHYFKKDKPFMNMLAQLAVSMASELGLHKDVPKRDHPRRNLTQKGPEQQVRTLEERRSMLAVFHLSSSTWTAYRKVEPLRWTRYLGDCLRILGEFGEAMDHLLIVQIKCQLLTSQLTATEEESSEDGSKAPSTILATALLNQLEDVQRSLPAPIRSERATQFYLQNARLTIYAYSISRSPSNTVVVSSAEHNTAHLRRLKTLEAALATSETWMTSFDEMPLSAWLGITVDVFAQFTQCLVVLFKLATLREKDWDTEDVKRRMDVLEVLDKAVETVGRVPRAQGIVDAQQGERRGLFFKTSALLKAVRGLFLVEMEAVAPSSGDARRQTVSNGNGDVDADVDVDVDGDGDCDGEGEDEGTMASVDAVMQDEFMMGLWEEEPWLSDILQPF
ncbi:hypothetical protein GGR50DRAFT_620706 [Xylaria sp. CBS 124048]|nr:hypothetical protein GGR50DRAFT_620706 [Xylaria sp. CBS 124048]